MSCQPASPLQWSGSAMFFLILLLAWSVNANQIPIVGFFSDEAGSESELAFRLTVARVNLDRTVLPDTLLVPIIERVPHHDSFNTSSTICNVTEREGVGGILGPSSSRTSNVVSSIATWMELPHLKTHWDTSSSPFNSSVNLYPDPELLAKGLADVVSVMDWDTFTVIYEEEEALVKLSEVFKAHHAKTPDGHVPFTVWQLSHPNHDHRPLLKEILSRSETRLVVDCSPAALTSFIHQAKDVGLIGPYYSYLFTSLDAHTVDLTELRMNMTNVTLVRLVDGSRVEVQAVLQDWEFEEERTNHRKISLSPDTLTTEAALVHDAVALYATAVHRLKQNVSTSRISCRYMNGWRYGYSLIQFLRIVDLEGMTGRMEFDKETGLRNFFTLHIMELVPWGLKKIGKWDPKGGVELTRSAQELERDKEIVLSNLTFSVVSRIGEPYLRYVEGHEKLEGNDKYEGFSMDLIHEISKEMGFKYLFYITPDNQYGQYMAETRQWNGLIRELRERRAHLAICDLTITYDRRSVVDFSQPFMNLGISILFKKPIKPSPDLFSFTSPLSLGVWMCMATAYLGVSLVLFFLSRISPYEWESPHPCKTDNEELECNFSLLNCMWLATGSLMQQGSDILPLAISTRIVAGVWWFFILIMISSYTANLAAFLTTERLEANIESVQDLAKQSKIKYGVLQGGSSSNFFRDSNETLYQKMWSAMESARPSVFVNNNDDGVKRVLTGKRLYAFFMESTSIEYQVEQHCDLMQVGTTLDSKGYGIAMPFQFPYRSRISAEILKMQESGRLDVLKNKWWKEEKHGKKPCSETHKEEKISKNELGLLNVGGMFLVLIGGCFMAFLVSILEFLWNIKKVAVQEKISPKEAFLLELKFAMRCHGTTKPVRKVKSEEDLPATFSTISILNQINGDD